MGCGGTKQVEPAAPEPDSVAFAGGLQTDARVAPKAEGGAVTQGPAPAPPPPSKAEPNLQELRKRTPEQEEANAAAAAAIAEFAAKAEAASEEERAPAAFSDGDVLWDHFDGDIIEECLEHTPLVDIQFLVELARLGGVLPCGLQNMPPAALITKHNLWRLKLWNKKKRKGSLGVLVFSYAWLDWFHPDRMGAQLRMLLPFLEAMLAEAQRDSPYCTVGVMVDFVCLPQVPRETEAEQLAFTCSLDNMFEWYFHPYTFVLLVTTAPPDADQYERRLHSSRGWCVMEKNAAMAVKDRNCLLDFSGYKGAIDFGDSKAFPNTCLGQMKAGREPPRSPPVFAEFMRTGVASDVIQFTMKEDAGRVSRLYQEGFVKTMNRVAAKEEGGLLDFEKLGWGDEEGAVLMEALRYAAEHCTFPYGAVLVRVGYGNRINKDEATWKEVNGKFYWF